jgi:hypothetical protein
LGGKCLRRAGTMIEVKFDKFVSKQDELQTFAFTNKIVPEVNVKAGYLKINLPDIVEVK